MSTECRLSANIPLFLAILFQRPVCLSRQPVHRIVSQLHWCAIDRHTSENYHPSSILKNYPQATTPDPSRPTHRAPNPPSLQSDPPASARSQSTPSSILSVPPVAAAKNPAHRTRSIPAPPSRKTTADLCCPHRRSTRSPDGVGARLGQATRQPWGLKAALSALKPLGSSGHLKTPGTHRTTNRVAGDAAGRAPPSERG